MSLRKSEYIDRLVDKKIDEYLSIFGAVSIEGPKWCGKTWASLNHANSKVLLDEDEIKEKAINYAAEHKVEKSVIMTVTGAVNCKIDYNMLEKEADADMCTVFEETRKEGEAKAIIELGFEFGLSEEEILDRLQKKLNISLQKAQEYFSMFAMKKVIKDEKY